VTAKPRYQIVEVIGRGGMGEVCLADDVMLHRKVALKFVNAPGETGGLEQLLGEARAVAALDRTMTAGGQMPVQSGDRAPDFVVPAVHEDRTISLADYRGKTPVLLGLFRGLYCPFCRRAMAQMAATSDHLRSLGVESLAIVGTELTMLACTSSSDPRVWRSAPIHN
jgi:serine/threonine protein kinase